MPVSIDQCCVDIGRFHSRIVIPKTKKNPLNELQFFSAFLHFSITKAGDMELNPGCNKNSQSYFFCCHWNVTSLDTDNYSKAVLLLLLTNIYTGRFPQS